jgi:UDP-N-acetylglucosamine acyltransferase
MSNVASLAGHVVLEDHVIIGGLTPVHQFVRIGQHSMIGGGLRVPKDVPPFILGGQEPLIFQGLNSIGLKRRGFSQDTIDALESAYKKIYHSGLNVSQAVAKIKDDQSLMAFPEVMMILEFIGSSKRGILAGPRKGK